MCHVYLLISKRRQKEIHDKTIRLIPSSLPILLNILPFGIIGVIVFIGYTVTKNVEEETRIYKKCIDIIYQNISEYFNVNIYSII